MKIFKRILLLLLLIVIFAVVINYPKLNILAGYSAKNVASSVFVANRTLAFTDANDNNFSPINLANDVVNTDKKLASADAFKLLTRTAFYREGLGAVLALTKDDITKVYKKPNRDKRPILQPYPFGNLKPKDSIFSNINYEKLDKTINDLFAPKNKTRAVVVLYKDHLIAEKYADGYDKNSKMSGWSMTKSITGTMFGILQHQQKLNVFDKAPIEAWKNDERRQITIHNLLQMNSGLAWNEDYNSISDVTKMLFLERNMGKLQAAKQLVGKPNETWNYSSGTSNLLSNILRQQFSTHQEYLDFWYTALIDKIGMHSMLIEADLDGNYVGSSYAWATARDWAKFGLLYLHNGKWQQEEIFDKKWVDYATTPTPTSKGYYGVQIWLNAGSKYKDVPKNMFSFDGYQGQNVYVLPDQDLVVVRMSLSKNADINALLKGVIDAVKE